MIIIIEKHCLECDEVLISSKPFEVCSYCGSNDLEFCSIEEGELNDY